MFLTPPHWVDKRRVRVGPEIVTLRPAIEVKPEAAALHAHHRTHADVGRVFGVHRLQLHVLPELIATRKSKHIPVGDFLLTE